MALTQSEKQKRYRANLKRKAAEAADKTVPYLKQSLSAYIAADPDRQESIDWCQQEIGLDLAYLLDGSQLDRELEFTENLIVGMLTTLETLTGMMNEYKLAQVNAAMLEVATLRPSRPAEAADRMEILINIRGRLRKKFRRDFAEYEVKGI